MKCVGCGEFASKEVVPGKWLCSGCEVEFQDWVLEGEDADDWGEDDWGEDEIESED